MADPLTDGALLTSRSGRVREARKLSRRSERWGRRLFLVEGWKAIEGALEAGVVVEVFATATGAQEHRDLLAGCTVTLADERAVAALSDAVAPQGLVAVCRFVDSEPDQVTAGGRVLAIAADVRDPGNAGTLLRTADAAGARGVLLAGNSVDPYNPKTVRASVGSLFRLPFAAVADPLEAVHLCHEQGYAVLAADGAGEVDLFDADELLGAPTAWLFGNEAWGLPEELAAAADHRVRIPVLGGAESLNLSTAAAVCLYASARVLSGRHG